MKEMKRLKKLLKLAGWEPRNGKKHDQMFCPCGDHIMTLARSASCPHAAANNKAMLRKMKCTSLVGAKLK